MTTTHDLLMKALRAYFEEHQKWEMKQTHSQTPVEIDRVVYEGVIVAAEKLSVSRQTINNWIKKGKAKYV